MRWYHWLLIPLTVCVALAVYIFGEREQDLASTIDQEIDALDARALAKRIEAQKGAEVAAAAIEERYKAKVARLDEYEQKVAANLRSDPIALADWLARIRR